MQGSQKSYANGKIFAEDVKSLRLPYGAKARSEMEFEEEEVALLKDNCPSHLNSEVMDILATARVQIVTLA
jgi:hypothetical protein